MDLAHVVPWSLVREHTFDSMIVLRPTCHRRFDQGEIDRESMRQYENLVKALVNDRAPHTAAGGRWLRGSVKLAEAYPHLVAEWHPDLNGTFDANDVVIGSFRTVWWRCACGNGPASRIRTRVERGCPSSRNVS
ncbi:hypothetical protein C5E51_26175 [Nocardia nova]|nr:hypothetical protein C5E51_26175 [Nocardia nova]